MSVWVAFPSCNLSRAVDAVAKWKAAGYRTAVYLEPEMPGVGADLEFYGGYPGYFSAVNILAQLITCAVCRHLGDERLTLVAAADDMDPEPNRSPESIAERCYREFPDGYFVMQPIGDDLRGTDMICGSPWMGDAWIREAYQGRGPLPPFYGQFYADEELFTVAREQGVLWQRKQITQRHHHWTRTDEAIERTPYQIANNSRYWEGDKATFDARQADGWPESGRMMP